MNSISRSFYLYAPSLLKEVAGFLNAQHKKIVGIVSLVFGFLGACYLANLHYFKYDFKKKFWSYFARDPSKDLSKDLYCPAKFNRSPKIELSSPGAGMSVICLRPETDEKRPVYEIKINKLEGSLRASCFEINDYHIQDKIVEFLIRCQTQGDPEVQALWDEKNRNLYLVGGGKVDEGSPIFDDKGVPIPGGWKVADYRQVWIRFDLKEIKTEGPIHLCGRLMAVCAGFKRKIVQEARDQLLLTIS